MSVLVEEYLRDYYELAETTAINNKLISYIDLSLAIEGLEDRFTNKEWSILTLFCSGHSYKEMSEISRQPVRLVRQTIYRISKAIENTLGWDYSDRKIHAMVAKRLNVAPIRRAW